MIVHNAYLAGSRESARASANVERGQGEGVILPPPPNNRIPAPEHRPVGTQLRDHLGNQVAKRERVVLSDIGRSGFAVPFQHFSFFHADPDSQGGQPDHVAR